MEGTGSAAGQELCRYTYNKVCNGGILRERDTDEGEKKNREVQGTEKSHDVSAGRRH